MELLQTTPKVILGMRYRCNLQLLDPCFLVLISTHHQYHDHHRVSATHIPFQSRVDLIDVQDDTLMGTRINRRVCL